jgi:hypothetical protein
VGEVHAVKQQVESVIGIDPGEVTGISFLDYIGDRIAGTMQVQVDASSAVALLESLLLRFYNNPEVIIRRWGQVEEFVTGQSAGTKGKPAEVTRQLVFALGETLQLYGYHVKIRKKADIYKKDGSGWASDKRLEKAGVIRQLDGMRHANDASRHALYCAVHDAYKPDPLR